jgi:hypothetical protein
VSRQQPIRLVSLFRVTKRPRESHRQTRRLLLFQSRTKKSRKRRLRSLLRKIRSPSLHLSQSEPLLHRNLPRGARRVISELRRQSRRLRKRLLRSSHPRKRTRRVGRVRRKQRRLLPPKLQTRRRRAKRVLERSLKSLLLAQYSFMALLDCLLSFMAIC